MFDVLFYVPPIFCKGSVLVFIVVGTTLFLSSFAIILTRKRAGSFACIVFLVSFYY